MYRNKCKCQKISISQWGHAKKYCWNAQSQHQQVPLINIFYHDFLVNWVKYEWKNFILYLFQFRRTRHLTSEVSVSTEIIITIIKSSFFSKQICNEHLLLIRFGISLLLLLLLLYEYDHLSLNLKYANIIIHWVVIGNIIGIQLQQRTNYYYYHYLSRQIIIPFYKTDLQ